MSKVKDELFTDQEPEESMIPDPEYDKVKDLIKPSNKSELIYPAMANILRHVGSIGKDQQNQQQRFKYRGIDDVYNALHSLFAKNEVFCTAELITRDRDERVNRNGTVLSFVTLRMRYTFHASDGSSVSTEAIGEGMDAGDKATNKAMAIAHKYALLQAFMIPTDEQKDPDAESHTVVRDFQDPRPFRSNSLPDRANKPAPNTAVQNIHAHFDACETIGELQEMWGKLTPDQHKLYENIKNICKDKILTKQADEDQKLL